MQFKQFQKQDYARIACVNGAILAHDPGLGKTWAAFALPLLKVGYTFAPAAADPTDTAALRPFQLSAFPFQLSPKAPVLIVAPGDLHDQFIDEGRNIFRTRVTRLDSQRTLMALSVPDPVTGAPILPPGYYITSYTQLGLNGTEPLPKYAKWPRDKLIALTGVTEAEARLACEGWDDMSPSDRKGALRMLAVKVAENEFLAGAGEWPDKLDQHWAKCVYSPTLADLSMQSFACVVVDEATKMKSQEAKVARGVYQMDPMYRYVLTATPIKNRVPDIFQLVLWATGAKRAAHARCPYIPTDKLDFSKTFCVIECNESALNKAKKNGRAARSRFVKITPQVCNVHRLWKFLAPVLLRRRKKDIGEDIVGKERKIIRVPMGTAQAGRYEELLKWEPKDVNGKPAVGAKLQALRMAAAAPSTGRHTPKAAAAMSILRDVLKRGEQCILFAPFHDALDAVSGLLTDAGVPHRVLDGRLSQAQRAVAAAAFKRQEYPITLASIECMAEGHSFNLCNNEILYSYPWALDKVLQASERCHRLNSVKKLNSFRLVADGTIDRKMESQIDEKSDSAELVLDGHLLGETPEETNLNDLLEFALSEFREGIHTVDESTLAAEWPVLRDDLRSAALQWSAAVSIGPAAATPTPPATVPTRPALPLASSRSAPVPAAATPTPPATVPTRPALPLASSRSAPVPAAATPTPPAPSPNRHALPLASQTEYATTASLNTLPPAPSLPAWRLRLAQRQSERGKEPALSA